MEFGIPRLERFLFGPAVVVALSRRVPALLVLVVLFGVELASGGSVARADKPAARGPTELAAELARLRSDVEGLASDIDAARGETRLQVQALESRALTLEVQLQREQERLRKLQEATAARKALLDSSDSAANALRTRVEAVLALVTGAVKRSLPYRLAERTGELDDLAGDLRAGRTSARKALNILWQRLEDELRLTRESSLDRQVVSLGDEQSLSDVVRIGTIMLFFRTPDGRVGRAARSDGGWEYRTYDAQTDIDRVTRLFESFQQRIRTGFFELPNALLETGEG